MSQRKETSRSRGKEPKHEGRAAKTLEGATVARAMPSARLPRTSRSSAPTPSPPSPQSAGELSSWLRLTRRAQKLPTVGAEVPCGSCNGCCRASYFIHIRPEEKKALQRIPRELLFPAPGAPAGHMLMGYDQRGRCPMLSEAGCTIYEDRPQTCRDFDCRVFAATGIELDPGGPQAGIAEQVRRWRFELGGEAASQQLSAVRAAAAFLQQRRELFPPGALPLNPAQLAALAIRVVGVFEQLQAGEVAAADSLHARGSRGAAPDAPSARPPDAELARAVLAELEASYSMRGAS
jgi:uncharacterized protein